MRSSTRGGPPAARPGAPPLRGVYADLDGTLLGPGGSLVDGAAGPDTSATEALAEMARAGIDLVLLSGRTRSQVRDLARALRAVAYAAEMGGLLVYREPEGELVVPAPGAARGAGTAAEAIHRSGAAGFVLEAFAPRLEPHAPWAFAERSCSVLFRGLVDQAEATEALGRSGYGWLELQDNGILGRGRERFPHLELEEIRIYHLIARGTSKRAAVAAHRARRGLPAEACIAVGDAASDAGVAPEVAAVHIVANGAAAVRGQELPGNVRFTEGAYGAGFAEAVRSYLRR